jgi:peptidoglycan/xylan/chitin deacetylase (PgdA/CDA1 family)
MKTVSIMYHDVIEASDWERSGFPGAGANIYKLHKELFSKHLEFLQASGITVGSVFDADPDQMTVLVTFDDGGESAYSVAADLLEAHGWRGHFFVTTDYIGSPTFLNRRQIAELHQRGHIIGSHSASHPTRMANCTRQQLLSEWGRSCDVLTDIIGEKVKVASVPGGYFSREVAETAAGSGIEYLFNSEPVTRVRSLGDCRILGRFSIKHNTSPQELENIAKNRAFCHLRNLALWNSKKIAKRVGGRAYLTLREKLLRK